MSEGHFHRVSKLTEDVRSSVHKYVDQALDLMVGERGLTCFVKVEEYKSPRSLSANNLYWMWLSQMATFFSQKGTAVTKDEMHILMRHKYLGYSKAKKIGKTEIGELLNSTAKLKSSEFCHYMEKIDAWAAQCGCLLKSPDESEYRQFLSKQEV